MKRWFRLAAATVSLSFAGCAIAAPASPPTLTVPVEVRAGDESGTATLEVTMDLPQGRSATVSTATGQPLGTVHSYGVNGIHTYTIAVPKALAPEELRSVVVRTETPRAEGAKISAVLKVPARQTAAPNRY